MSDKEITFIETLEYGKRSLSKTVTISKADLLREAKKFDHRMIRALGQYKIPQFQYFYAKLHTLTQLDKSIIPELDGMKIVRKFMNEVRKSPLYNKEAN